MNIDVPAVLVLPNSTHNICIQIGNAKDEPISVETLLSNQLHHKLNKTGRKQSNTVITI